jgi:pimeloyl-ACP methyl ester carboxylesterase
LGERSHLGVGKTVTLRTHVEDVIAVLEFEDLRDVVLCGASYGGVPVTGAADRVPERVSSVVYVDALVPRAGESALDLLPQEFGEFVRRGHDEHGPGWRVPLPDDLFATLFPTGVLSDQVRDEYMARIRDHPAATFIDPVGLKGAVERLPRAFVRCTTAELADALSADPIEVMAGRARAEGWLYRELATRHDPQIFDPVGIAGILEEVSTVER